MVYVYPKESTNNLNWGEEGPLIIPIPGSGASYKPSPIMAPSRP